MFETSITVVGRIITDFRRRVVADQEVISFRVASNSRRRTAEGTWEPGQTLYITVNCWGKLVTGVGAGLYKGAPIIAVGTVHTSEYEDREGVKRSSLEMRASAVGPDLSRVIARIEQPPRPNNGEGAAAGGDTQGDEGAAGADLDDVDHGGQDAGAEAVDPVVLSA
ncbi:MAG: single-stranded DNA-binding protein [Actinomycetia bacterium]|nr:single-stranded DNA-binding protein [Actinomycetes bacterium]